MKDHLAVSVLLVFQSENCPGAVQAHACYFHKLCPVEFAVSSPVKNQHMKSLKKEMLVKWHEYSSNYLAEFTFQGIEVLLMYF